MQEQEKILTMLLKVAREMRTTIVPYPEMGNFSEKDIRAVKPSTGAYQGEDLLIYEKYCVNPQCDCRSVHLDLVPASDKSTKKRVCFQLNFDTKEIDWPRRWSVPEEFKAVAEEFGRDLYENLKPTFRQHYHEAKEFGTKLYNLLNACDNFKRKAMVSYGDISPGTTLWSFSDGKEIFTVIDHYCAQPDCLCQDVVLTFYPDVTKKEVLNPLFAIRLKEDGRFVEEESSTNHDEIKRLISAFELKVPHLQAEVLSRLQKAKEFGRLMVKEHISNRQIRRLLEDLSRVPRYYEAPQRPEPVITKKKVGRNEPCPCGSGKKYKKCCGR